MLITLIVIILISSFLIRFYMRARVAICLSKEEMAGKVVIVTGATSGIGFEIARGLAERGARVILTSRSEKRGASAAAAIVNSSNNNDVVFKLLDLASLQSIRSFCRHVVKTEKRLDVLVNNAAGIYLGNMYTSDGIVEEMQVNYFGPFLLTMLLWPLLQKSRPSRIVMVSSTAAFSGEFVPENINKQKYYSDFKMYSNSKLCHVMICVELSRRFKDTGVVVNAVHPGIIYTSISKNAPALYRLAFKVLCWFNSRNATGGAQTPIYLAVAKECEALSGKFFADCKELPLPRKARDNESCISLWKLSTKLVGYKEGEEEKFYYGLELPVEVKKET